MLDRYIDIDDRNIDMKKSKTIYKDHQDFSILATKDWYKIK